MSKIPTSERSLNRIAVQIRDAVQGQAIVRFKRAQELVAAGKAEWIYHPLSDPRKIPTIAMIKEHHACIAAECSYDRIRRRMTDEELFHVPVMMRHKLIEQGGADRRRCGLLKRAKATVRAKNGIRCIE